MPETSLSKDIVGRTIELLIGEPWDFHDPASPDTGVRGSYPFYATLVEVINADSDQPAFLIKTAKPFHANGAAIQYLCAVNRYSPEDQDIIADFRAGGPVSMNFVYRQDGAGFSTDEVSSIRWSPEYGGLVGGMVASDGKTPFSTTR
ncbi:MAG: hypothetical protein MnENMB40S_19180 [Rhizobiaceae bacterium MnEN-MB40S]|nr:MAG: hypothetical protein MnENMB40S_19180 [Rhizobiaceae bacterium MnEN-MB40S]